jgi:hypothetical protein
VLLALVIIRNSFLFTTRLYEDADMGANSILVEQARRFRLLVGNYSREKFDHPGPAYLYVKAAGEQLFWAATRLVPTAWNGQLLAVYGLNALFVALVTLVVWRWTRSVSGALAGFAAVAALLAVHPEVMVSDWMPYWYVLTYIAFLAGSASVAAGRTGDAWIMALAGWFLINGHVCYLFFVPLITCAVVLARSRWRPAGSGGGRWWMPVAAISAVFALPIVVNLALHWPGQFGLYLDYIRSGKGGDHHISQTLRYALWFWWPYRYAWLVVLAAVAVAILVTWKLASGPPRRFLAALLALNAVSSAGFLVYALTGVDHITAYYIGYFYWSAPVITLLVILVGLARALPARAPAAAAAAAAAGAAAGAARIAAVVALAACATALALFAVAPFARTSVNLSDPAVATSGPDTDPGLPAAVRKVGQLAGGRVAIIGFDQKSWPDVTGFLVQAERTGVRACVPLPSLRFMVTSQFICSAAELRAGRLFWFHAAQPATGSVIIARLRQAVVTIGPGRT